jgi:hypothetical protein
MARLSGNSGQIEAQARLEAQEPARESFAEGIPPYALAIQALEAKVAGLSGYVQQLEEVAVHAGKMDF